MYLGQPDITIRPSFFDDMSSDNKAFWKKRDPAQKLSDVKLIEGQLFRKSKKKNAWKLKTFALFEDRLAYFKLDKDSKDSFEQKYCLIENMRLEPIVTQRGLVQQQVIEVKSEPLHVKLETNELQTIVETTEENQVKPGGDVGTEPQGVNPQGDESVTTSASVEKKEESVDNGANVEGNKDQAKEKALASEDKEKERGREQLNGFKLIHNRQSQDFYINNNDQMDLWLAGLAKMCILTNYSQSFVNIKAIGKGSFARVYLAKRRSDNEEFAVKTFGKELLAANEKAKPSLINEINIMRKLDHDNIIRLYNIYESDHHIYLVLELLKGGELFDRIVQRGQYDESDACTLMQKLLSALSFMHSKGIMHRDLKPENLILKGSENDSDVKIADFGLATFMNVGDQLFKRCGTPGYVAPEILADQQYNEKVDIFSAGVILYVLLTGGSPFYSESYNEILWKNKECQINFNFREFGHKISPHAVDLMKKMLEKDPVKRISAQEALEHQWIQIPAYFTSPSTNTRVFLQKAQQNMKKLQEDHLKTMKAQVAQSNNLERSIHAPSPLITGRTLPIADANLSSFASPDLSIGAHLAAKQRLANLKSPMMTPDINKSRTMMTPDMNQYARSLNQYLASQTPQMNSRGHFLAQDQTNAQKVTNVQENLMKYLQFPANKGVPNKAPGQGTPTQQFQQMPFAQPNKQMYQPNPYQPGMQPQTTQQQQPQPFMPINPLNPGTQVQQPQPQPVQANANKKASNVKDKLKGFMGGI